MERKNRKVKKAPKEHPVVSFRATPHVLRQLEELRGVLGENNTQVIYRAIQCLCNRELGDKA